MPATPASPAAAATAAADPPVLLSVGEAAAASGMSAHTLRYYDRIGLLATQRTAAGQRRYGPDELLALAFIARLRATGMPVRRIKAYADAVRAGRGPAEGLQLLLEHRERLLHDLAERQAHLAAIDRKIAAYTHAPSRHAQGDP